MTLRDDFREAVAAVGGPENPELEADGTWTTVVLTKDDRFVPVRARMSLSGEYLSLEAMLAELDVDEPLSAELLIALLRLNADADRIDGASCGVQSEEPGDIVLAICHWNLPTISQEQFAELLTVFARSVRNLHSELVHMSEAGAPVRLINSLE